MLKTKNSKGENVYVAGYVNVNLPKISKQFYLN